MSQHQSPLPNQLYLPHKPKMGYVQRLFLFFCAYVAIPIIEVPVIGLSLSAPVFIFLAFETLFKVRGKLPAGMNRWLMLSFFIAAGIGLSFLINGLKNSGDNFGQMEVINFCRYCYWALVFIVSILIVVRKPELGNFVLLIWVIMICLLSIARWYEAVRYGSFGAWTRLYIMTQNEYSWLFSNYSPLVLAVFLQYRKKRVLTALAGFIIYSATLINGSRSGWITLALGTLLFILMYVLAFPTKARVLFRAIFMCVVLAICGAMFWKFAPQKIRDVSINRFITFESLETDKSYQIRKLMQQKGLKIFKESPIEGCGVGRFRQTKTDLDLPPILRYASESFFNNKSSHNSYVQFLAETGLLGAIPYVILIMCLIIGGFFSSIVLTREHQLWPLGVYVTFITMSVHMWSLSAITNTGTWLKYGMVAAIICIAKRVQLEKRRHLRAEMAARQSGSPIS